MGTPLANPIFLSDSPRFLNRQKNRSAHALVTELVGSVTCLCLKCSEAARARAVPGYGCRAWPSERGVTCPPSPVGAGEITLTPELMKTDDTRHRPSQGGGGAMSSSMLPQTRAGVPSPRAEKRRHPERVAPDNRRDFHWLIQAIHECFPGDGGLVDAIAGSRWASPSEVHRDQGLGDLIARLGVKIPDTVLLKNGKPRKKFWLDASGRLQVENLKSSAQLLRVLRQFVAKAQRPRHTSKENRRASSKTPARQPPQIDGSSGKGLNHSKSEPSMKRSDTKGPVARPNYVQENLRLQLGGSKVPPMTEVAVLYYDDGAVRYMTSAEACKQMENASRLPKEFWQHIVMLQVPVSMAVASAKSRYITYNFDAANREYDPQAPLPLRYRRKNSVPNLDAREGEAQLVKGVPRLINQCLAERKGKLGLNIVSGRFEFVYDEAEDSLWLINAGSLRCAKYTVADDEDSVKSSPEEIRYFKEDEFAQLMSQQEDRFDYLKDRWHLAKPISPSGLTSGVRVPGESPVQLVAMNAADKLSGAKEPHDLVKYYEAETEMLNYYMAEIKSGGVDQENKRRALGAKAPGLIVWFRRWVRSHRGRHRRGAAGTGAAGASMLGAARRGSSAGKCGDNAPRHSSIYSNPFLTSDEDWENALLTNHSRPQSAEGPLTAEDWLSHMTDDDLFASRGQSATKVPAATGEGSKKGWT